MAALPPEDEKPQLSLQVLKLPTPSFRDRCWEIVIALITFLVVAALGAYIVMLAWNSLVSLTALPGIDWRDAFAALFIVRVLGAVFNY